MKYILYAYNYEDGWVSSFVNDKNMKEAIDKLDPEEYGRYFVVTNKDPKLLVHGFVAKAKEKILKPSKK